MADNREQENQEGVQIGRSLVAWEADEYPRQQRSARWYAIMGAIALACIIYAVLTANFLFAVIILMIGIITLLTSFQEPERIQIIITTTGIVIGDNYFEYRSVKDFSIVYQPPEVKTLYMTFKSVLQPLLVVPLEDADPNVVRDSLLPYCIEDLARTQERLTDTLRRVYKL
jgi:hypothetical protein